MPTTDYPSQLPEALSLAVEQLVPRLGLSDTQEATLARVLLNIAAEAKVARSHIQAFVPSEDLRPGDVAALDMLDVSRACIGKVAARWLQYEHGRRDWEPGQSEEFVESFVSLAMKLGV